MNKNALLILIQSDIDKYKRRLKKVLKELEYQITLEKKVNLQRYKKYLEIKISHARKEIFEIENLNTPI